MLINATDEEIFLPFISKNARTKATHSNILNLSADLILFIYSLLNQNDKFSLSSVNTKFRKILNAVNINNNIEKKITYGDLIKLFHQKQTYEKISNVSCSSAPLSLFLALFSESIVALPPIKALGCVPAVAIGLGTAGCVGGLSFFGCCAVSSHYGYKVNQANNQKDKLKREIRAAENNNQIPTMSMRK